MRPTLPLIFCLFLAILVPAHVWADDEDDDDLADHDRARAALERGEVMSLRDIMGRAEASYAGRLLEVELETEKGQLVYDIEILAPDGRLIELLYDARTGALLQAKAAGRSILPTPGEQVMRILIAEDDANLRRQLADAVAAAGYVADQAADGIEAAFLGESEPYDAIVLDLGLPGRDGLSVLRAWRADGRSMPVLILTARGTWQEKVEGMDAGADDYLAKPFRMEELLARLRALIRRVGGQVSVTLNCGPVTLDTRTARVTVSGTPVTLTAHEQRELSYLMHHQGRVISRTELTEHVYAQDFDRDSNTIEVFIGRLRRKLGADLIHTERGLGYRMEAL